jgi:tetratricopeptide (TPR) repeat protein
MNMRRTIGLIIAITTFAFSALASDLNVEQKSSAAEQYRYAVKLLSETPTAQEMRSPDRDRGILRAAGAFEICMLAWPKSPYALRCAESQTALYMDNFMMTNAIWSVQHAEQRGLLNGEIGPTMYAKLGMAHERLGHKGEADEAFRRSERHPSFSKIDGQTRSTLYVWIGATLRDRGEFPMAASYFEKAAREQDSPLNHRGGDALEALRIAEKGGDRGTAVRALALAESIGNDLRARKRNPGEEQTLKVIDEALREHDRGDGTSRSH